MWRKIHHPDELDWNEPFVLKPVQGSKTRDVLIWHPDKLPGSATKTKVSRELDNRQGGMYHQNFEIPTVINLNGQEMWMIYRIFFGYNIHEKSWKYLGGVWNARQNLKIHGASDAVFGPIKTL